MNQIEFTELLSNPSVINKSHIKGLTELVNEFPFFQAGQFLLLYGLKKRRSFKYNDHLKLTAAYTGDRNLLFDYITSISDDLHPAPRRFKKRSHQFTGSIDKAKVSDQSLAADPATEEDNSPEKVLQLGKPLEFSQNESFSFQEWMQLSSFSPIDRSGNTDQKMPKETLKQMASHSNQTELIDKFIATNPKIEPGISDSFSDIAANSVIENEQLMTETLAHVYIEQKKYKKAITAFSILSLKYPEKSSFFASQIEAVKQLQEK